MAGWVEVWGYVGVLFVGRTGGRVDFLTCWSSGEDAAELESKTLDVEVNLTFQPSTMDTSFE